MPRQKPDKKRGRACSTLLSDISDDLGNIRRTQGNLEEFTRNPERSEKMEKIVDRTSDRPQGSSQRGGAVDMADTMGGDIGQP